MYCSFFFFQIFMCSCMFKHFCFMPLPLNNFPVEDTIFPQDSLSIVQKLLILNIVIEDYEKKNWCFLYSIVAIFACLMKICVLILKFANFNKICHTVKHDVKHMEHIVAFQNTELFITSLMYKLFKIAYYFNCLSLL